MFFLTNLYENYPLTVYYLVGINIATLFLYGFDKLSAAAGMHRIRETTLLLFALFGGSLGAILGIKIFRHKTRKDPFLFMLGTILVVQIVLVLYFFQIQ